MNTAIFRQGGLGLPDRDYYLNDDARSKQLREKYVEHLTNMFKLIGMNEADAKVNADKVMTLETRLAKASSTRVELRDPVKNYNKMTYEELEGLLLPILTGLFILSNIKIDISERV